MVASPVLHSWPLGPLASSASLLISSPGHHSSRSASVSSPLSTSSLLILLVSLTSPTSLLMRTFTLHIDWEF